MAVFKKTKSIYYNDVNLIAQPAEISSRKDVPIELYRIIVSPMAAVVGQTSAKEATKHITDAKGKELGGKVKEEGGDNLAEKKAIDELEEVTLTEDELAIDAMLNESDEEDLDESAQGEVGAYAHEKSKKKDKKEDDGEELDEAESKNNPWAICTASVGREDKEKYEACVRDVKKQKSVKEELKGGQHKIDANKNGKIDGEDFKLLKKRKTNETWGTPNKINTAKNFEEWLDALDDADAKEVLKSIYFDLGKPVVDIAKKALKKTAGFIGGPDVRDAIAKRDAMKNKHGFEEGSDFPDLTGDGKVTRADILKGRGVDLDEEMSIEEIQEAIADLKKKL